MPDDVRADELDDDVRRDLMSLSKETAELVARHLVMTGLLIDDDPDQAFLHARAAGALAGRVAVVREAAGLAAYAAGAWSEALSELRAARRMSGSAEHLPVMADAERALGRPERALAAYDDPAVASLDQAVRVELVLVVAGARRDLGQQDAAVLLLQGPARATTAKRPWAVRLWYGYADALLDAGRPEQAREWFAKAATLDEQGQTDAAERVLALDGLVFYADDPVSGSPATADDPYRGADAGSESAGSEWAAAESAGAGLAGADLDDTDSVAPALDAAALQQLVAGIVPLPEPAMAGPAAEGAVAAAGPAAADQAPAGPVRAGAEADQPPTGTGDQPLEDAAGPAPDSPARPPFVPAVSPFSGSEAESPVPVRSAAVPGVAFVTPESEPDDELARTPVEPTGDQAGQD